jgi:hypothetical protein
MFLSVLSRFALGIEQFKYTKIEVHIDNEGHLTCMRLRAHDHYTSSTLIDGKGGARPSSLHTTLEGPTGVCECKMDVKCQS